MFCNQCEQTAKGVACTVKGVCGKSPETDVLQDLLIYTCAGLAEVALEAERKGIKKPEIDFFLMEALFSTLTNVDFDPERIKAYIEKAVELREILKKESKVDITTPWAKFEPASFMDELIKQAEEREIEPEILKEEGEDIASLKLTRNYYTEFVEKVPQDCIVLTLGCGKFRFFDKDLGTIESIPRLLDVGQCNDAYSAIQIAIALSKAFNVEVNELPLSLILSWYEQKAVAILLTLLYLGIKNIRLGPSMPAFLSKNVANFIMENYNLKPITTPEEDIKAILG
ncbi:MAG: hypothetical protein J7K10_03565 [Thermodesulfobacterium sp.]|nr:hypothetical protein [Thermodesulfobacterium sp.]